MNDDLIATFVPRFVALAQKRLDRALELLAQGNEGAKVEIARDLHSIAGEAGMLGLAALLPLARDGEGRAKRLRSPWTDQETEPLREVLDAIRNELAALK